ncbi:DUF1311 domain-containing protein [Azotobacter chroococcum]|uniref:DUF1311 domain-containing protein n=1 Tax=Azotobacter chroococcum TaxID=353 RepID=A0AA43Z4Y8_9GAMM|nr:lysozyme inhibitor LprI family protein [Azotobacter chroococcum]NHN76841.1 DUF1311 domain-containing protein [Azotobacter chroococcum]
MRKALSTALALLIFGGTLPATAEVYPAGSQASAEFAQQNLAGVYKLQKGFSSDRTVDPGFLRVALDTEGNVLLVHNDTLMGLTLQSVDTDNHSANLLDGRGGLATFKSVFGTAKLTLEDGTTHHAIFVRALAPQDIAVVERAYGAARRSERATTPATPTPAPAPAPAPVPAPAPSAEAAKAIRPSFDCLKASTAIEGMICGNAELADLDTRLADAYKWLLGVSDDPAVEKREQIAWIRNKRNACKTVDCLIQVYTDRADDLEATAQYLSKPKEFR